MELFILIILALAFVFYIMGLKDELTLRKITTPPKTPTLTKE